MTPITVNSPLSKKDVILAMKNLAGAKKDYCFFIGKVWQDGFLVTKHRLLHRRVMLDPQFKGAVTENEDGTEITIKVALNNWDKIGFSLFGLLYLGIIIYFIIKAIATASFEPLTIAIIVLLWIALTSLIFALIFTAKAKRILKILKKHLT